MQKQIGSILFVAGTTIGSGVIALPMIIAKLGLIPSILLMLGIWTLMYYTAIVNLELNLQTGKGLPLGALGKRLSGPLAGYIGTLSFTLLSYALLAVYLYGGASILQKLILQLFGVEFDFNKVVTACAFIAIAMLIWPIKYVDYINRLVFSGKCLVMAALMVGLVSSIHFHHLPLITNNLRNGSAWSTVIPVIFTSFGFQVIFHTMTNYCEHNPIMLKRAFFWGSLIPAIIYILWTSSVLIVLYHANPDFYQQVVAGKVEIGAIIKELSQVTTGRFVQALFWWISNLAVITSIIGVGLGLIDSWKSSLQSYIKNGSTRHFLAVINTILPAYMIAALVPNAFIKVLGFAGMILVIIAVLLPIYLLQKAKVNKLFYPELTHKSLRWISILAGLGIMACEMVNML